MNNHRWDECQDRRWSNGFRISACNKSMIRTLTKQCIGYHLPTVELRSAPRWKKTSAPASGKPARGETSQGRNWRPCLVSASGLRPLRNKRFPPDGRPRDPSLRGARGKSGRASSAGSSPSVGRKPKQSGSAAGLHRQAASLRRRNLAGRFQLAQSARKKRPPWQWHGVSRAIPRSGR